MALLSMAVVMLIAGAELARAITPTESELHKASAWINAYLLAEAKFPYEFMYGGQGSRGILPGWKSQRSTKDDNAQLTRYEHVYSDSATGLEVRCDITQYKDFPAVEWVLRFTNRGNKPTPILHNVLPLNVDFINSDGGATYRLRYSLGSHERTDDFRPFETKVVSPAETLTFAPVGGRSSDGYLPFFNLQTDKGGVCLGVGWTGQWQATFRENDDRAMNVRAGMEFTHFKLEPGESVRTPAILLVFWDGDDSLRGQNLLRGTLRDHFSPRPSGKPVEVPLSISAHATYAFEKTTSDNMVRLIEQFASKDAGFDTFWIDTGWFELINENWARSVGNFDPDKSRYPEGMKPVSDAAHKHGMKFLLWFEPERVMPDTWMMKTHPDWVIKPPPTIPFDFNYEFFDGFHLLDLGNEEALKWLITKTISQIRDMGVDVYRQDFNMYPLHYWRSNESADRLGIHEMHYVEGLYRLWDALLAEYPQLLIDNCASGGRRIDFETLRRSVPLFRSDMVFRSPLSNQCQELGLSEWIPYHGVGAVTVDPYAFRSGLGAVFNTAFNVRIGKEAWKKVAAMMKQYRTFRDAYVGDFYPLSPYSLSTTAQLAWQFDRPDLGEGLVQAFRREECPTDSIEVKLQGLEASARYSVTNLDNPDDAKTLLGSELIERGIRISLPANPSAAIVLYKKL
jgi:alpha-galactosidase